jgi:hypothetical protein
MSLWTKQYNFGKEGEALAMEFYSNAGCAIEDVSDDAAYQKQDIDFIAYRGNKKALIEVKYDRVISRTGNLFLEINTDKGESNSPGWFKYSNADILFYIDSKNAIGIEIKLEELRNYVDEHQGWLQTRTLTDNFGDFIKIREGICLPLYTIEDKDWCQVHSLEDCGL